MALEILKLDDFEEKSSDKTSRKKELKRDIRSLKPSDGYIVTDIKQAVRNPDRANIFVNGKYRLSLEIAQIAQLGVKIGLKLGADELAKLEQQSEFGKLYVRALEYCLMRPHSEKEMRDYLYKKTLTRKQKNSKTGELYDKKGVSKESTDQVFIKLKQKKYIDDEKFASWWVENRNQKKGTSIKKLRNELMSKGVAITIIDSVLKGSNRNDLEELNKVIAKKSRQYPDEQKLIAYLLRQGFLYDDIKSRLEI